MNARANIASTTSSEISAVLADLERLMAEWTSFDWTTSHPSGSEIGDVQRAVAELRRVIGNMRDECRTRTVMTNNGAISEESGYTGVTILLAEDNTVNRMVADGMLRQFQCRIDVVENGEEAVRQFQDSEYDLIFMDCQMPVMDGFDAVARIREIEATRSNDGGHRTPIVALTANALKGDRDRCINAGMDDYVSKPFSLSDLRGALDRQLGAARTSQIRALRVQDIEDTAARATTSSNVGSLVDSDVLDSIRKLRKTDGAKLLVRIIDVFLDSSPRLIDDLEAALTSRVLQAVATTAHALRSCCGSVGATRLATLSKSIETQSEQGTMVDVDEWSHQLRQCYKQTMQELILHRDREKGEC